MLCPIWLTPSARLDGAFPSLADPDLSKSTVMYCRSQLLCSLQNNICYVCELSRLWNLLIVKNRFILACFELRQLLIRMTGFSFSARTLSVNLLHCLIRILGFPFPMMEF